ncbi:hypothetical protein PHYPSEUDO_011522 [Phytophthora pseudosyringae]|uniref:Uncharacterized protein n=1 Tax=Phytophthora pseudosyringae TaxID=221518 RepID=A0A8T1V989_9STRA|nr:hypothetical protein PHYPSEUDO_011522 [Phytophthora pseudosyringae]
MNKGAVPAEIQQRQRDFGRHPDVQRGPHGVRHGPRTEILDYFEERGFSCPPRVDPADFLIEETSGRGHRYSNAKVARKDLTMISEDFNNLFCQSSIYKKAHEAISPGFNEHQCESPEDSKKAKSMTNLARSKQQFRLGFHPEHAAALESPEAGVDPGHSAAVGQFERSADHRTCLSRCSSVRRGSTSPSCSSCAAYSTSSARVTSSARAYSIAETVVQTPATLSVSFILGTFFYFMSGLTRTFEKYIVFCLERVCFQHAIGANMLSEFSSDRYTPVKSAKYLDNCSITQGTEYVWFGIGILLAYYLLFTTLNGLAMYFFRYEK